MSKPFIIGITGGSGSGKTSVIRILNNSFNDKELCLVSQDNYYKKREEQKVDNNGITNFDLPECIDHELFLQHILSLQAGHAIELEEYTFNNSKAQSRTIRVESAPIIIVEGLFVFYYKEMRELMDLKVFIDASDIVKLKRRINRDKVERNYPVDDVLYRYEHHVTPAYQSYIQPFKKNADIIINNEFSYERGLKVLEGFIWSKLDRQ